MAYECKCRACADCGRRLISQLNEARILVLRLAGAEKLRRKGLSAPSIAFDEAVEAIRRWGLE